MIKFHVEYSDAQSEIRFDRPAFELMELGSVSIHKSFYEIFKPFGLQSSDIKINTGGENLSDKTVSYYLPTLDSTIKLGVDRIQYDINIHRTERDDVHSMVVNSLNVVKHYADVSVVDMSTVVGMHGDIQNHSYLGILKQFINRDFGENLEGGAVLLRFGNDTDSSLSSILIEPSRLGEEKVFIRVTIVCPAKTLEHAELYTHFEKKTLSALKRINISVEGG